MHSILLLLAAKFPIVMVIVSILGCLAVVGQAIVVITPSKKDDAAWDKLKAMPLVGQVLAALVEFAPIQKK